MALLYVTVCNSFTENCSFIVVRTIFSALAPFCIALCISFAGNCSFDAIGTTIFPSAVVLLCVAVCSSFAANCSFNVVWTIISSFAVACAPGVTSPTSAVVLGELASDSRGDFLFVRFSYQQSCRFLLVFLCRLLLIEDYLWPLACADQQKKHDSLITFLAALWSVSKRYLRSSIIRGPFLGKRFICGWSNCIDKTFPLSYRRYSSINYCKHTSCDNRPSISFWNCWYNFMQQIVDMDAEMHVTKIGLVLAIR